MASRKERLAVADEIDPRDRISSGHRKRIPDGRGESGQEGSPRARAGSDPSILRVRMVEAAGVEPASESEPARDPTGLARPSVSPRS